MSAPCRPFGAESRMPLGSFSTVAPNARSASRWKSIGRSPMRHPPRSGMKAWPRRCRSGPQKRIGMRDAGVRVDLLEVRRDGAARVEAQDALAVVLHRDAVHLEQRAHDLRRR
jgi:hypothetical protein